MSTKAIDRPGAVKGPPPGPYGDWQPGLEKTRLYDRILMDIMLGDLAPMRPLAEKGLAVRYSAGLAGVRAALRRLAIEGLVMRRPRVGTVVAPLDFDQIEQAFQVRRMLAGRTARLAAMNAADEDREAIEDALAGADAAVEAGDYRALLRMEHAFYRAVALATHNPFLARFAIALQGVTARYWLWRLRRLTQEDQLEHIRLRLDLARAIVARDPAAAEAAALLIEASLTSA